MTFSPTETLYDSIDTQCKTWDELPAQVQEDLLEWLNVDPPDKEDKARLLKLYVEGRFRAWYCPLCSEEPRRGNTTRVFQADVEEEEWCHFQGSLNQDFSFFGDSDWYTPELIAAMCDSCRC